MKAKDKSKGALEVAFDNAFEKSSLSNDVFFNNKDLSVSSKFVAWIDIMGSKNIMTNALRNAAVFVGILHQAVLLASKQTPSIQIHSMTDGVFAVAKEFNTIRDFLTCVMRSCAHVFCKQEVGPKRFFIRSAVAYGLVVDAENYETRLQNQGESAYLHNVMLGVPFVNSYSKERMAPPFGIYIDESVRTQTDNPDLTVAWVLHRWWSSDKVNEKKFSQDFGNAVLSQIEWLSTNPLSTFFDPTKADRYRTAVKEYFQL